jgi:hypothetical protein
MSYQLLALHDALDYLRRRHSIPQSVGINLLLEPNIIEDTGGGYMHPVDDEMSNFEVIVGLELPLNQQLRVLAHEFRHVYQYYNGWLTDLADGFTLWKGYLFDSAIYADEPMESPEEKDANKYEDKLTGKLVELFGD